MNAAEWVIHARTALMDCRAINADELMYRCWILPRAIMADGFEISIQASEAHHCSPRKTYFGPYISYELGYPSSDDDLLHEYEDGFDDGTFSYVPANVVEALVEKHGGITGPLNGW